MAVSTREVRGLSQMLKNMEQLPKELVSKNGGIVRSALFKAIKLMRDDARRRAPKRTGNLAANIIVFRDTNPRATGASERYFLGVRKVKKALAATLRRVGKSAARSPIGKLLDDAYYWRFIEFGTEKMKAQPFLRPAFEAQSNPAVDTFVSGVSSGIQRVVKRMRV